MTPPSSSPGKPAARARTIARVWVAIVTYRCPDEIAHCLQSLAGEAIDGIVIADNSPDTATRSAIGEALPTLAAEGLPCPDVIVCERNLGFAAAANLAVRQSVRKAADWVLLLNPDTQVEAGMVARLREVAEAHAKAAVVAPLMVLADAPRHVASAGHEINALGFAWDARLCEHVSRLGSEPTRVLGACGGAALVDAAVFLALGGFEPGFFAYLEDVDFSLTLARRTDRQALLVPDARVRHAVSGTFRQRPLLKERLILRNATALALLHFPRDVLLRTTWIRAVRYTRALGGSVIRGEWTRVLAWFAAVAGLIVWFPDLLRGRRRRVRGHPLPDFVTERMRPANHWPSHVLPDAPRAAVGGAASPSPFDVDSPGYVRGWQRVESRNGTGAFARVVRDVATVHCERAARAPAGLTIEARSARCGQPVRVTVRVDGVTVGTLDVADVEWQSYSLNVETKNASGEQSPNSRCGVVEVELCVSPPPVAHGRRAAALEVRAIAVSPAASA